MITLVNGYHGIGVYKEGKFVRIIDASSAYWQRDIFESVGLETTVVNANLPGFWKALNNTFPACLSVLKKEYKEYRIKEIQDDIERLEMKLGDLKKELSPLLEPEN